VQTLLASNNRQHRTRSRAKEPNLLAGLLVDANGTRLTSSHTVKNGKRYRYYTGARPAGNKSKSWRVPAPEMEAAVIGELRRFLGDRQRLAGVLKRSQLQAREIKATLQTANDLREQLDAFASRRETALKLIKRVVVSDSELIVELKLAALIPEASGPTGTVTHRLNLPVELVRQNGSAIVLATSSDRGAGADPALVKALARGFAWFEELATGRVDTVTAIAKRERVTDRYVSQLVELAFIDPRLVHRVLAGTGQTAISTTRLIFRIDLPQSWLQQEPVIFARPR
jgi:hypothetical protein